MKNQMKKKPLGGGVENKSPKSYKTFKSFVALGLSTILPSFAFSNESDEALTQLLSTTPSNPNDSKVQTLASYSPVVDLRTSRAVTNDGSIFNGNAVNITQDTIIGTLDNRWNVTTDDIETKASKNITIANGATLTINATNNTGFGYVFAGVDDQSKRINWSGGNIVIDFQSSGWGGYNNVRGGLESDGYVFEISSNLDFTYREDDNTAGNGSRSAGVSAIGSAFNGSVKLLGDQIKINSIGKENQNIGLGIFSLLANRGGAVFLNAKDDGTINKTNAIVQVKGSISTGLGSIPSTNNRGEGKIYAHFTGSQSFLEGNIYSGLYGGNSEVVASFNNNAQMRGEIVFLSDSTSSTSNITFTNAKLTGDINALGSGNHNAVFDRSSFIGTIKKDENNIQGTNIGGSTGNTLDIALGTRGNGTNTTITFSNTAGKEFGTESGGVVASSYAGNIIGTFDVSQSSTTKINGGTDGSKGFLGSGTNTLTFDFKNNAKTSASAFTIGGGNANSLYIMSGFTQGGQNQLDLSNLGNSDNTLYKKLEDAGIKVAVDATSQTTNNHLNGTLFFQKTNIQVSNNGNALFATKDNIVGSSNDLNGLALGAMFGNAIWNDENNDGVIIQDEIVANANGVSYQLTNGTNPSDSKASNGNIGKAGDNIKKQVAFIFADGTEQNGYVFGGGSNDKQGYSGTIAGGTADSKYYFANAGYINRTQIENAEGALVLFNTAFRGDLGVGNKDVDIMLDFSENRNGLRAESGIDSYANIVGAGRKNITFNFTKNTKEVKYGGAVVGDSTKDNNVATSGTDDNQTAKYTMLNLTKYSSDNVKDNNGELKNSTSGTLIDAIRGAGLSGFNNPSANDLSNKHYGSDSEITNTSTFSTTKTTLALRGTSLNTENMTFSDYKYDFVFGSDIGEVEGVIIQDSKLYGDINLSSNANTGHSIVLRGDSLGKNTTTITFKDTTFGSSGASTFVYDDSTPTNLLTNDTTPKTLKISGLSDTNYLSTGSALNISNTNFEGDIWANQNTAINLNFANGNTWTMDNSGLYLASGSNIVINGKINPITTTPTTIPILKIFTAQNQGDIQLINTGAVLKWNLGKVASQGDRLGKSFDLRGTSLEVTYNGSPQDGNLNGIHGKVDSGSFNLVFAKGTNLQTTIEKSNSQGGGSTTYYNITEEGSGANNYIAESYGKFKRVNIASKFNITYIGEDSHNIDQFQNNQDRNFSNGSKMTFVNASNGANSSGGLVNGALDGSKIGNFFGGSSSTATITLEGTTLTNGNSLVTNGNTNNQAKLTFDMTFIKDSSSTQPYVDEAKYGDLATTTANGALSDRILKVAQSSLNSGIDFKNSNFNVLFVGNNSQNLSDSNIFKNGTDTSTLTFRDSDLNAGTSGNSSIQGIKGTITFDLSHNDEDMAIYGTLSNMLASGGKHQVQFSGANNTKITLNKLVFVGKNNIASATTLSQLGKNGQYFNDTDTFGTLSQANYSDLAVLSGIDASKSSSLVFGKDNTDTSIAISNQEVFFVGADSHGFGVNSGNVSKLGNSTGSTLTFIDAGNLKLENIVNIDTNGDQQGKGTINLIGTTNFDLTADSNGFKTLTLYKQATTRATPEVTGAGITINAIFTGSNPLGASSNGILADGGTPSSTTITSGHKASTANIGQVGEQTIYHILFDYTSSNLTFGTHHAYTGNIVGLTSDSIIKFKNAGYINQGQIENTQATILVDNTQIKGDFRGDNAILDFRNGNPAISGNILTSDIRELSANSGSDGKPTTNVLSQKILTFDLTGTLPKTTRTAQALTFGGKIQAGDKVASAYTDTKASVLTFQNAPTMTLGNDIGSNTSSFIKSLASDVGFSGIANASIAEPTPTFNSTANNANSKASYILAGTKLVFEGTSIDATSLSGDIVETTYDLDLRFDNRNSDRGNAGLGGTLEKSILTADSIVMGNALSDSSPARNLALTFKGVGSLNGATKGNLSNVLDVKLKENARFDLTASSSNGNIGTIILSKNTNNSTMTALTNVAKDSTLSIGAGSMSFIGNFTQKVDSTIATAGAINVAFNGINKVYGTIAGQGEMNVSLSGDSVFDNTSMTDYSFANPSFGNAGVLIDASAMTSGEINIAHTSGKVGIKGKTIVDSNQTYSSINLSNAQSHIALQGAFDTNGNRLVFNADKQLDIVEKTDLKFAQSADSNWSFDGFLTISEGGITNSQNQTAKTLKIGAFAQGRGIGLNLVNIGNVNVELYSTKEGTQTTTTLTKVISYWKTRGVNIQLKEGIDFNSGYWIEEGNGYANQQEMVFAKGNGTETTTSKADKSGNLKLSELTTDDKINESTLTRVAGYNGYFNFRFATLTFIGKEALGIDPTQQTFDGRHSSETRFNLYNSLIKAGSALFDSSTPNSAEFGVDATYTLRGTDVFNLSATTPSNKKGNWATIDAVFVNGTTATPTGGTDNSITGVRYIDSSSYASEYATSNAGGALSQTQLKTLESKAYGNITLGENVTARIKFVGENSHSFDGKVLVKGSGTSAEFYAYTGTGTTASTSTLATDWKQISVNNQGVVSLGTAPSGNANNYSFATLSGGKSTSRFDFDHTSVSLDQVKNAKGKTYVYNSNVIGNIAVNGLTISYDANAKPNEINPSTTLFFNAKMEEKPTSGSISADAQELTKTAKSFIDSQFRDGLGINLDLSTAHTLTNDNLTNNSGYKLGATKKQTNIVLIGKGSVTANGASGSSEAINLNFLPETANSANYAYTIISGGVIQSSELEKAGSDYEIDATIFGNSKVQLVDTYIKGAVNIAQVGFINTNLAKNHNSSWGGTGNIGQYLIFDMGENKNQLAKNIDPAPDVITNSAKTSRYIFSNLAQKEVTFATNMKTTLNNAMNGVAPSGKKVIGENVTGYLGLRGVSVVGDIDESASGGNGVDIVFNSTSDKDANQGIAYKEWFATDNTYHSEIVEGAKNLVSHGTDYENDPNISGYAVLKGSSGGEVTIKGTANKDIVFIGSGAVEGGFDNLKIEEGSVDSNYTFYAVGTLGDGFLKGVKLQKNGDTTANLGTFTFANSTISGNINVDKNASDTSNTNHNARLIFDNVVYSGTISGDLIKDLTFAKGSDNVKIIGGSDYSSYDFSNLAGSSISLDIDMRNGSTYYAPTITGFDGNTSLVGSIKLAKTSAELAHTNANYSNSFAFNENAKWTMTDSSRVMKLTLNNSGTNFNLDLYSASRASSKTTADSSDLRVLEVTTLASDGGQVLLGTEIDTQTQSNSKSDKIKADTLEGTLYITAKDANLNSGSFSTDSDAIVLVEATNANAEVQGAERKQGLSYVKTDLEYQVSSDDSTWSKADEDNTLSATSHRWVLSGFSTETNQELVDESGFLISNPYRMLLIETNNLNKRMGDLRDNDYNQGAWIRVFNGSDSGEGSKNLYTNIQLGYDYGTPAIGAKNYTGVAFSTSIVDISGNQYSGKANTYSLAVYNAHIADSGLYVDTIGKYLYTDQKLSPSGSSDSSFGSHALSLGLEVGYRAYMGETSFYFEPQAEVIGGVIFGVRDIDMGVIGGMNITGDLKTTTTINTRVGLVQGYSLKTQSGFRADFRVGVSLVNEFVSEDSPVTLYDGITEASTNIGNDVKAVVNVGTNLILTDQWRVYIDAERSFGGNRNVDYQANIGARFSFGDTLKSLPKVEKPLPLILKESKGNATAQEKNGNTQEQQENSTENKAQ